VARCFQDAIRIRMRKWKARTTLASKGESGTPPDARVVSLRRNRTAVTLWLLTGSWLPAPRDCRRAPFQPCVFCIPCLALSAQMLYQCST